MSTTDTDRTGTAARKSDRVRLPIVTDAAEVIRDTVTVQAACERYGIHVNSRTHKALCPFHTDTKPSLHVYSGRRGFYCYVCNKGGSVIDFVMALFGLDFKGAIKKLNDDFSLGLTVGSVLSEEQKREASRIAYQRRKEQERRRRALERLQSDYDSAYDRFATLDVMAVRNAPSAPYGEFSEKYAYALKHIDAAWDAVQEAAWALEEFKQKER